MTIKPPLVLREEYVDGILDLLKSVTVGSNGALYQHQRLDRRIERLYRPLFLNLERNGKVRGNITFCRRPENWYIRYFAFDLAMQSSTKKVRSRARNSGIKRRIEAFFQDAFQLEEHAPQCFYAYIDPQNERSLWMSENFDFHTIAKIATQTFTRINPKEQASVKAVEAGDFIRNTIESYYGDYPFYFTHHTFDESPFYILKRGNEICAFAKVRQAEWKILRLPGRTGGLLKKAIPYVPGLRKIINPDAYIFSVVDSVWVKEMDPRLLRKLYEGILYKEKTNSLMWWVDNKEPLYQAVRKKIRWGLLHKFNGVQDADLVVRRRDNTVQELSGPTYTTGFDFI